MDSKVRHELSRAIQREGVGLFENPQRIKALLMDACPESRTEISLLVQAAEDDIPARLARSSESVFRDTEIARAVADLKKTRRLDDGAAEWVVRSWAWTLGVLDTEPSDDVREVTSVTPTPSFPPVGQAGSPPYPSAPPSGQSGPGDTRSFPPAGSSSRSGPYSEPWQSGVTSGGQSAGLGPGAPLWASQPPAHGPAAGSWGGPPPASTGWGAVSPSPPPGRGRGRLFTVLGSVAAVIVLAMVGGALVYNAGSSAARSPVSPPPPPSSSATSAPPSTEPVVPPTAPTDPAQEEINFTITTSLADLEIAETTTVYSFGQDVGELRINTSQPYDSLSMSADGPHVDYQLKITLVATDGEQYKFTGAGTITVSEGSVYAVDIEENSAGNFEATLTPKQDGI